MPDIAMCGDKECPSREKCYRFMATPSPHMQSYSHFGREVGDAKCDSFWPVKNKGQAQGLDRAIGD